MSYNLIDSPYLFFKKRNFHSKLILPSIKPSKNLFSSIDSHDLESKFFFNHKYNHSWNIEDLKDKFMGMKETENLHILSLESEENKEECDLPPKTEKKRELNGFLKKCNRELIDSMVSKSRMEQKFRKNQKEMKKIQFESLQIKTKTKEKTAHLSELRSKPSQFEGFCKEGTTPKLRLSQIHKDNKKKTLTLENVKNFETYFARFLRKSKLEDNFKDSFIKHIRKLSGFREKKLEKEENAGKIDQKLQELIINNFRRQNKIQMELENRKKIDSLKGLGSLIDQEITQQDETLDDLIRSFKKMVDLKGEEVSE